ncbi:MAG TPA: 3-dehydroquinate synthase [Anaerolineae bacterium]|nr:3-dehydroquinate synthase [Anaerolineae bacterium]HQK13629.1 3-dehydroquinate synthase [Anaerolineae bacterium]
MNLCSPRNLNLILTGFMGTGKTTVGREVARRLGRAFVDMDDVIVARAGKPIPHIFAEDGEAAFRALEAAVCIELSAQDGLVIATGGGALVNPANRITMERSGVVVCLDASPDEILRRVGGNADRPLLNVPDPAARVAELLTARRDAYGALPWHVATTGRSVDDVTAQVLALAETITLPVRHPGGEYPIHIGRGLLAYLGGALRAVGVREGTAVAIVTNTVVGPLYAGRVETALREAGYRPFVCTIPDGEQHKTLDTVRALYEQFLAGQLDRSGVVLALGGGVTGDIAGFAAATFMRGVRFVQVPTTLLAMTDASVGGKTGVDLPQGKNLVGAFKQPEMVLIDLNVLDTLPEAEFRSGMAELLKHGVIGAPELVQSPKSKVHSRESANRRIGELRITNHESQITNYQLPVTDLARSLRVKIDIVEEDPFEQGRRAVLNLGHTTAHGLEQVSAFTLRHGDAVSIGMVTAARIAEALGRAEPGLAAHIADVLAAWGLPVTCPPYPVDAIWQAMTHDKKKQGKGLRWILPRAIGDVTIADDVPETLVRQILMEMGAKE